MPFCWPPAVNPFRYPALNLTEIDEGSMNLDVTGHYYRPDLFDVNVRLPE